MAVQGSEADRNRLGWFSAALRASFRPRGVETNVAVQPLNTLSSHAPGLLYISYEA